SPSSPVAGCPRPTCATSSGASASDSGSGPPRSSSGSGAGPDRVEPAMRTHSAILLLVAVSCVGAAFVWGRSTLRLQRASQRISADLSMTGSGLEAARLARAAFRKSLHTTILYGILAAGAAISSISEESLFSVPLLAILIPVIVSLRFGRSFFAEAPLAEALATAA